VNQLGAVAQVFALQGPADYFDVCLRKNCATADALANMNFEEMDFENAEGVTVPYSWLSAEEREEVREAFREAAEALREAAAEFE